MRERGRPKRQRVVAPYPCGGPAEQRPDTDGTLWRLGVVACLLPINPLAFAGHIGV